MNLKSEIRIPEIRKKPDGRRPKNLSASDWEKCAAVHLWSVAAWPSGFGFLSEVGFRTSDFKMRVL